MTDLIWTGPTEEQVQESLRRAVDVSERIFAVVLFAGLLVRISQSAMFQPSNFFVLPSEGLVAAFMVFRRSTNLVSDRLPDWIIALLGTTLPMLVRPGGVTLWPPAYGAALMLVGLGFGLWGKLCLKRSFGLAAANRGVIQSGAYKFVRHPIYAGYVLGFIGFFSINASLWNGVIYLTTLALTIARIRAEERVLTGDPKYVAFAKRVPYCLVPGLY